MKRALALLLTLCLGLVPLFGCAQAPPPASTASVPHDEPTVRSIVDMRGVTVEVPHEIDTVAIFDKGFLVQTMTALGVSEKIAATGGLIQTAVTSDERDSLYLLKNIFELPQIGYMTDAVDFETLASVDPDLVILRNSEYIKDSEITAEAIKKIEEDLQYPLIVVNGPGCYEEVKIETQYEGIRLLGEIFYQEERAEEIIELMQRPIAMIRERTKEVAEENRPSVMYLGGLRGSELSGTVWGSNYGDAKFGEEVARIRNVHNVHEAIRQVSAEQIITLDPDVLILCTVSPAPEVFLHDALYRPLRNVKAVQDERVASLGLLTWWGDFRLEVPTILLITAKSVYPEQFRDIRVGEWLNDYHQELYNLTPEEAQELKVIQELDWMDEASF